MKPRAISLVSNCARLGSTFSRGAVLAAVTLILTAASPAASFTVTQPGNDGPGSLRQAILDANADLSPDPATIEFNIPQAGVQTIAPLTGLPTITRPVIIDGYTQPGSSSNTLANADNAVLLIELSGASLGAPSYGFWITADGSKVRGLVINRFIGAGEILLQNCSNAVIEGNFIGTDATGTNALANDNGIQIIGGTSHRLGGLAPGSRNVIGGNQNVGINDGGSVSNAVLGNFIGLGADGLTVTPNGWGIYFGGCSQAQVGGTSAEARNVISGNSSGCSIHAGENNLVQGNFIGTDATGHLGRGNIYGIVLEQSTNNVVGGTAAGAGNVISGNSSGAVLQSDGQANLVAGNFIGTDVTGTNALGNLNYGVLINGASGNTVGGTQVGAGNVIADNGGIGVGLLGVASANNAVLGNSIFANGALGIDLGTEGPTPNDIGDADGNPNHFQNFPEVAAAVLIGADLSVSYRVDSAVENAAYPMTIEFFRADARGQGKTFLHRTAYETPQASTNIVFSPAASVQPGDPIVATATDANGNTSEFSATRSVVANHAPVVASPLPDQSALYGSAFLYQVPADSFSDPDATDTLSYAASGLPPEIVFQSATRSFIGTPTSAGAFSITVAVTDDGTPPLGTNDVFDLIVGKAALVVTANNKTRLPGQANPPLDGTLLGVTNNDDITVTFMTTATSGSPPGSYPITPVFNDPAGRLSNYAVTTNAGTLTVVDCSTLAITNAALPGATEGAAYNVTLRATNGTPPYTFALTGGTLPGNLSLASNGLLSGTPTNSGNYLLTVAVTSAVGCVTSSNYVLNVVCPAITVSPATLPAGTSNSAYSQSITASGGFAPYSFTVTSGALPSGLSLSSAGLLSGTPTNVGNFTFTLTATDAGGCAGSRGYTLTVGFPVYEGFLYPAGALSGQNGGNGFTGAWSGSSAFVVVSNSFSTGGPTSGNHAEGHGIGTISRRLVQPLGDPGTVRYLSAFLGPVLTGSPSHAGERVGLILNGTTGNGVFAGKPDTGNQGNWVLANASASVQVASPSGVFGPSFLVVKCEFFAGNDRFTLYVNPPAGQPEPASGTVKFDTDVGSITNIALAITIPGGNFDFGVYDEIRLASTYTEVVPACPTITVGPATLADGQVGQFYAQTNSASGGQPPYTFTASGLPAGVFLSNLGPATCVLSGTPSAAGLYSFSVNAQDANGCRGSSPYAVTICAPLIFGPAALSVGYTNVPYSQTLTATNGQAPYSFTLAGGALPPGLSLASSGVISGAPIAAGDYAFTVSATDANGCPDSHAYAITVFSQCPAITVSPPPNSLPPAVAGVLFSNVFTATGGLPPYTFSWNFDYSQFSVVRLDPSGIMAVYPIRFDSDPGVTNYTFTVSATDAAGCTVSTPYPVRVHAPGSVPATSDQLNLPIPPTGTGGSGNPASDTCLSRIQVNSIAVSARINQIRVGMSLEHTSDGDLVLTLISPGGDRVLLASHRGAAEANYLETVFDNDAAPAIADSLPPFSGVFRPEQGLGFAGGTNLNGTWTLEIEDTAAGHTGVLRDWWLQFASGPPASALGTLYSTNLSGSYVATDSSLVHSLHQTYLVNGNSNLICARTLDGSMVWTQRIANLLMRRPLPVDRSFGRSPVVLLPSYNQASGVSEVRALNPTNGAVLWTRPLITCAFYNDLINDPAFQSWNLSDAAFRAVYTNDDLVFVTTDNPCTASPTNKIYALRASTGANAWVFNATGRFLMGDADITLDVRRNTLFCSTANRSSFGLDLTNVWAINTIDGSLRWSRALGIDADVNRQPLPPLLANGALYVALASNSVGRLVKLDPDTGATLWSYTLPTGYARAPLAFDPVRSRILVRVNNALSSIQDNGASAAVAWNFNADGPLFNVAPVVIPEFGAVYIYSHSFNDALYSIDLGEGYSNGNVSFPPSGLTDVIGDSDNGGASTTALVFAPFERYQAPVDGLFGVHIGNSQRGDLGITGTLQPTNANLGAPVVCTLTVTNRGTNAVSPVYVGDVLPPGLAFASAVVSRGTYFLTADKFAADLGTLPRNGAATISLELTSTAAGIFEHRPSAGGYAVESFGINNSVLLANRVFAPTQLQFQFADGALILSWPADPPTWLLMSNTNLASGVWTQVSPPPVLVGGKYAVTNPATGEQKFFHLRSP